MGRRLEEYTHEELIEYIKTLKKQKRFGLVWEDKPENVVRECETKLPVVKEVTEKRIENAPGEPTNIIIEGDNYHALSVLNYTHAGKIDVIYIDPPYNTGNKDFIYNDCYVDKEDTFRHSKWLSFMEKRLKLAKTLLADDGVIFISIDDNEQATLKLLCDSIFNDSHMVANFIWEKKRKASNLSGEVRDVAEYVLCYRNREIVPLIASEDIVEQNKPYPFYNTGNKRKKLCFPEKKIFAEMSDGVYKAGDYLDKKTVVTLCNDIEIKNGLVINSFELIGEWRYSQTKLDTLLDDNERIVLKGTKLKPYFINNNERIKYVKTILSKSNYDVGTNEDGNAELAALLGNNIFSYPKPTKLIQKLIQLNGKEDSIVLDFFAGSGTTGQAVMELNKEDGGHRQFILVTNNEANGQADAGAEGIAEKVTYPRIKTVITGIRPDGTKYSDGISANLRYFKTDFVEKGKTTDDTREALITECCDMIRIRENAFEHIASAPEYRFYKNDKVFVPIIFDQFAITETWELVEKLNTEKLPVHCYNFSYNRHANEEEIPEDTELTWTACSIPETVLEVYRKIFRKKKEV